MSELIWTGYIRRGPDEGTLVGELKDDWGWTFVVTGTRDIENGGYRLECRTMTRGHLEVPLVDDPPTTRDG